MINNLILNCLPPSSTKWASPAMSILKAFMESNGYKTKVIYWNIIFDQYIKDFYKMNASIHDDVQFIIPFFNYLNVQHKDEHNLHKLRCHIKQSYAHLINSDDHFWENLHNEQYRILDDLIISNLEALNIKECKLFGVPAKLHQIVPANIIASKVRQLSPNTSIVIGGIGTKEEAEAILRNFPIYEYAIWGEGEYPLLMLYQHIIEGKYDLKDIPHLAFRNNEKIILSKAINTYLDLNSGLIPDFSDFFEQNKNDKKTLSLPIEGSRGCHWMKCKFCFLNDGYKYRKKNNEQIIKELRLQIQKYDIREVMFLDNDMIGKNIEEFELLLDQLIELRNDYNDFKISLGEIISKGTFSRLVKKMSLAGFYAVQIGYESPSNELLNKINKKNTFASNFLFMKWAYNYSIRLGGLNVLRGLLEETEDDIMEGISNLKFQRFLLTGNYLHHNISSLAIGYSSRYYKQVKNDQNLDCWNENILFEFLPEKYIDSKDKFILYYFTTPVADKLWAIFQVIERHYLSNSYEYALLKNNGKVYYQERLNKEIINELEFDTPLHWEILTLANHKVTSLDEISSHFNENEKMVPQEELIAALKQLKDECILYTNKDYSEIVSVINTEELNVS